MRLAIQKSYGRKGEQIVAANLAAIEAARGSLQELVVPAEAAQARWPSSPSPLPWPRPRPSYRICCCRSCSAAAISCL